MTLTQDFLDDLRDRVSVSSVVGRALRLEKKGREYLAICPFHTDTKPSLSVVDHKGFYHCFACGAHGDVFKFLMENSGLGFMEAVEQVASLAGVTVPKSSPEEQAKAERHRTLQEVVELACAWYEHQLRNAGGEAGLDYLRSRGLTDATISTYRLGWAPNGRKALQQAMGKHEIPVDTLIEAGLVRRITEGDRQGDTVDVMRGRVLFPIMDRRGRVIAFGGRLLERPEPKTEAGDTSAEGKTPSGKPAGPPKYLNSADSPIFRKGRVLYGLAHAMEPAHKSGELVVVEGYMDTLALAQEGFAAVAPLGTALTAEQIAELWRVVAAPILCFDGDAAGQKAAVRAGTNAMGVLKRGKTLRFASLPRSQDPDDLIRKEGPDALRAVLDGATGLADLLWDAEMTACGVETPEQRADFHARVRDLVRQIQDSDVQQAYRDEMESRIAKAREILAPTGAPAPPGGGGGGEGDQYQPNGPGPHGCPVIPLGIDDEATQWYITPTGRLLGLKPKDHSTVNIVALSDGDDRWLWSWFPRMDREGIGVIGWTLGSAQKWLIRHSVEAGTFDRRNTLRGHGAWRPLRDDGTAGLIVHCGNVLLVDGERRPPGRLGTRIYPTKPALPLPAPEAASAEHGRRLLRFFEAAPFDNEQTMPRMALGALGVGFLVGALEARPMLHIGGDKGSGKSTILSFFSRFLSDWAENLADATEAAIRSMLAGGAKAILLDEMEPEELQTRGRQLVRLARLAWSDDTGSAARGTQEGGFNKTPLRASFVMASIIPPPMEEADADRFTFLRLSHQSPMPKGWAKAQNDIDDLLKLAPLIHRRLIDHWPRIQALIPVLRQALSDNHHAGRTPMNLAVLLACSEILTSDLPVEEMDIPSIVAPFDPLERSEQTDDRPGWQRCLDRLLTSRDPDWSGGTRHTIGELIADELATGDAAGYGDQEKLKRLGLRVIKLTEAQAPPGARPGEVGLAIASAHEGLSGLFEGSAWANGGWSAALRAGPDIAPTRSAVRFFTLSRATFVPIWLLGLTDQDGKVIK